MQADEQNVLNQCQGILYLNFSHICSRPKNRKLCFTIRGGGGEFEEHVDECDEQIGTLCVGVCV